MIHHKTCDYCESAFKSPMAKKRFCSVKCHTEWWGAYRTLVLDRGPLRACDVCGNPFQSNKQNRRYCGSKECVLALKAAFRESNRDRIRDEHLIWRTANRERWIATGRAWRAANIDPVEDRERKRAWAKANPGKVNAKTILHRARKRNAQGSFTAEEFSLICKKQGGKCARCRKKIPLECDHIVPLSKGGTNFAYNIQGLCRSCNATKSAKMLDYALPSLFDTREVT